VDGFSDYHSGYLMHVAMEEYNVGVVRVLSPYMAEGLQKQLQQQQQLLVQQHAGEQDDGVLIQLPDEDYFQRTAPPLDDPQQIQSWLASIPFFIEAIICESDSGLDYAEQLACAIAGIATVDSTTRNDTQPATSGSNTTLNPTSSSFLFHTSNNAQHQFKHNGFLEARRDKYEMNEVCRFKGIPIVKQVLCRTPDEAIEMAQTVFCLASHETDGVSGSDRRMNKSGVIIKPRRGVASDRVALCRTTTDIREAARRILNTIIFGTYDQKHDAVLMQEFIDGTEYAVDVVSRNGNHKTAALWVYEKTSTSEDGVSNPFAYLSGKLVSSDDPNHPHAHDIMDYVDKCLTALGIAWGMSHTEVKLSSGGDIRLMEVNVRQQNDHFGPICSMCMGYNALDLCLSAYLDDAHDEDALFARVPRRPILQRNGMIVNLACFVEGEVSEIRHVQDIQELESFVAMELFPGFEIGSTVQRTKDIRSDCGWVHLVHESEDCMMRDYNTICTMMPSMFDVCTEP
jgi:biotin carboxylase